MYELYCLKSTKTGGKIEGKKMIKKLSIVLEKKNDITYLKGSLFHGILMEQVDPAYGEILHLDGLKPYSQSLHYEDDKLIWDINTLNEQASKELIEPLTVGSFQKIEIKHDRKELEILEKREVTDTYQDFVNRYYFENGNRRVHIQILSPTSFKQNGRYVFYPDIRLIFQSLMMKFDTFADNFSICSEEVLEQLVDNTHIIGYNLKSVRFHLEGISIPAFIGYMEVQINGPQPLVNLVHLLLRYGEYSGVGIKTSMGMGAMRITDKRRGERK